ncbi:MAG: ABC-type transport auxiliary lipoprotein family protein [Myxococcota bacterium]|nr:ABC-type transport auxiliary lipoprotein family protein [Myxococcota bacterium]
MKRFGFCIMLLALQSAACGLFGRAQQPRNFYVLAVDPLEKGSGRVLPGLVRVSNMDTASTYDKFQIVMRESPYQLQYSDLNVWAVKPGRMVSDVMASALREAGAFDAVTRELGERRPDYTMAGDLNSIEVYNSGDAWFAHLAISLAFTRFSDGQVLWTYSFDRRKQVPTGDFAAAIRGISELLSAATQEAVGQLGASLAGNLDQAPRGGQLATPMWPLGRDPGPQRERRDVDVATDTANAQPAVPVTPVQVPEVKPRTKSSTAP